LDIERAIHERWAATGALEELLPVENVTTGRSARASVPYATIERDASRPSLPTNSGNAIEDIALRIHVWHDDYDAGRAIAGQVEAAFDGATLTLAEASSARLRRKGSLVKHHADGAWQWVIELRARVFYD